MKWLPGMLAVALTVSLAGCSQTIPFVAGSPAARFSSTECSPNLDHLQDVTVPTIHPERLLNPSARPAGALICEYGNVGPGHPLRDLAKHIDLPATSARRLAVAVSHVDLGLHQTGTSSCGDSRISVTVIVFRYSTAGPVDLWWRSSGCQTIDNGATAAEQAGNDSFGHFQAVFQAVTRAAA